MNSEDPRVIATTAFFRDLRRDTMHLVDSFYAPDALFRDPLVERRGREAIRGYYAGLYANVRSIRFDFESFVTDGDGVAAIWVMHLEAPRLNGGKPVVLPGVSHFSFNGETQAKYHRDYFDMGAFIYEQVPVLKQLIGLVKSRLKH